MDKENFLKELLRYDGEEQITIKTNEDEYMIEDGGSFVGGEEGTYMSELLGNVYYDNLKSIGMTVYDYIVNELKETVIEISLF